MKRIGKTIQTKEAMEPMAYELAEWFYGQQHKDDVLSHSLIAKQIMAIRMRRGKWKVGAIANRRNLDYSGMIDNTRTFMINMYKLTLQNFRQTKTFEGGYKVANDAEATHIGEQRIKRWGLAGQRAMEMIPLMKKQHLSKPIRDIFKETLEGIHEIKSTADRYLLAYDEAEKDRRKEAKSEAHELAVLK